MAPDETKMKYFLPPENYEGVLIIQNKHLKVRGSIFAGEDGALQFNLEPIPTSNDNIVVFDILKTFGRTATPTIMFSGEFLSVTSKRIKSDAIFLNSYNHQMNEIDGNLVRIGIKANEAILHFPRDAHLPKPRLCLWVRGFRCFRQLHSDSVLGKIVASGSLDAPDTMTLSGKIVIEANEGDCLNWMNAAEDMLYYLVSGLGFANSCHLSVPVREYYYEDKLEVRFINAAKAGERGLHIQHHLNLQPFFSSLVASFKMDEKQRKLVEMAVGWFQIGTSYQEIRFLTAMTALEYLVSHAVPVNKIRRAKSNKTGGIFRRLMWPFLKPKWTLREGIEILFSYLNISRIDITDNDIRALVHTRNDIIHRGKVSGDNSLWQQSILAREIIVRVILKLMAFEGHYECYIGGGHMRSFPDCQRIKSL